MVQRLKSEVKVNGIDITSVVTSWSVVSTFGNSISECDIRATAGVKKLLDVANGQSITIKRGIVGNEEFVFEGIVDEFHQEYPQVKILGKDRLLELLRNEVTKSYDIDIDVQAGVGSEIFKDLVNTYTPLVADNTSVVPTPAGATLKKFICNHVDVFQRALALADIYGYQMRYSPVDGKVHFEPQGFVDKTGDVLTVGVNVSQALKWELDNSQCVNDLTVEGAVQDTEVEQNFVGDGATAVFTIAFVPKSVRVQVAGVDKTLGVPDSSSAYNYSVDKDSKQIRFVPASVPTFGQAINVKYITPKPVPIRVKNSASIGAYGTYRMTKHFEDVQTVTDARKKGEQFVAIYGVPFIRSRVPVIGAMTSCAPGEMRRVVDSQNARTDDVVVNQVQKRYPEHEDLVSVGNKEYKTQEHDTKISERIKRLEEELVKNQDILISVETFGGSGTDNLVRVRKRFARMLLYSWTGTLVLLWDNPLYGTWDAQDWGQMGTGDEPTWVVTRLVWPDGTFEEEFIDDAFKDAGNTTATWNVTTHVLSFAPAQVAQSTVVYTNDETYASAVVTVTFAGTPTFYISSDNGATWTTCAGLISGKAKTVAITSTTGKGLKWKATGTTGDSITSVLIAPGV